MAERIRDSNYFRQDFLDRIDILASLPAERVSAIISFSSGDELDEFAVILQSTTLDDARHLAHRLLKRVRAQRVETDTDPNIRTTLSIGVAELWKDESATTWLDRADNALYRAKQSGRDRVEYSQ